MNDAMIANFQFLLDFCQRMYLENRVMAKLLNNCAGFDWKYFDQGVADQGEIEKAEKFFAPVRSAAFDSAGFDSQLRKLEQDLSKDGEA
ncbi:MAG: hypothetical protein NVS9B5_35660 [Terriglobales bacterium]